MSSVPFTHFAPREMEKSIRLVNSERVLCSRFGSSPHPPRRGLPTESQPSTAVAGWERRFRSGVQ